MSESRLSNCLNLITAQNFAYIYPKFLVQLKVILWTKKVGRVASPLNNDAYITVSAIVAGTFRTHYYSKSIILFFP